LGCFKHQSSRYVAHPARLETGRPAIITAAIPFWDQVALNAVAPLVTAVFGLLLAGLVINLLTRALQDRRTANQLKYDLLSQITEVASTLFHYAGLYHRARAEATANPTVGTGNIIKNNKELDELRKEFLTQHATGRTQTDVLEARLAAYFEEPRVAIAWHAVRDCLTVRVYSAIGGPEKLLREVVRENSKGWEGRYHTGLAENELTDSYKVWKAYDCHLKTTTKLILACPLRPHKITRRARQAIDRALDASEVLGFNYEESNEGQTISPVLWKTIE
jgi:hypothetical protein